MKTKTDAISDVRQGELQPKPKTDQLPPDDIRDQKLFFEKFDLMLLDKLFSQLAAIREGEDRLLDRTMILFGSNMGDANTHDNTNLPILLAGGGFRHGQHLAFRHDRNQPLCNLFVTMLQKLGIETNAFGSSTGTLNAIA